MNLLTLYRKLRNRFYEAVVFPIQPIWLRHIGVECAPGVRLFGFPIINKCEGSVIKIGSNFTACAKPQFNTIGVIQPVVITTTSPESRLVIGNHVGVSGCSIACQQSIGIGNRVSLGSGVLIMDNDAHSLNPEERFAGIPNIRSSPVILEEDVWVGARSIILKGTKIGSRTIVRAGSVVFGEFPPDCIIGGNPATVISAKKS